MNFTDPNMMLAKRLRDLIVQDTQTIGDGIAVAMVLLWLFTRDEATNRTMEPDQLLRQKVEAFLKDWAHRIRLVPAKPRGLNG